MTTGRRQHLCISKYLRFRIYEAQEEPDQLLKPELNDLFNIPAVAGEDKPRPY